jgi:hypothetical protein
MLKGAPSTAVTSGGNADELSMIAGATRLASRTFPSGHESFQAASNARFHQLRTYWLSIYVDALRHALQWPLALLDQEKESKRSGSKEGSRKGLGGGDISSAKSVRDVE